MNNTYVKAQSREAIHCGHMKMKMLTLAPGLIASVLVFSFILKVPQVYAQTSCNYYASPNGTGNGLSPSTPFQISKFWSVATPGKTLCLLDGTYTGEDSLIRPPDTFAGTASNPITIRAVNDGKVLIDGGTSRPVDLQGSYGILEGVNISGGDNKGLAVRRASDHWTVRRVVVWNNNPKDTTLIDIGGTNATIEDCAAFGNGRKVIAMGADGGNGGDRHNVVRRCWARWENRGEPGTGPSNTLEMGYDQDGVIYENIIGIRDMVPGAYISEPAGPFDLFATKNSKWLGSIAYILPSTNYGEGGMFAAFNDGGFNAQQGQVHSTENTFIKDIVAYVPPSHPDFNQIYAFDFSAVLANTCDNMVGVAGAASSIRSPWTCTNVRTGTSLAAAIGSGKSIWNEVPGICKRYVNGQLTNEGLWPWPMNQRIKDALVQSGRAPVDITQTMEELLGPIPQACTTGAPPPVGMLAPRNLRAVGAK